MRFNSILSIFVAVTLLVITAGGQDDPIRSRTDLVTVNIAVTNEKGKFVERLEKEQFEIFDNNEKQQSKLMKSEVIKEVKGDV